MVEAELITRSNSKTSFLTQLDWRTQGEIARAVDFKFFPYLLIFLSTVAKTGFPKQAINQLQEELLPPAWRLKVRDRDVPLHLKLEDKCLASSNEHFLIT